MQERMYRNSVLLMLNAAVGAALGFLFWTVAARVLPAGDIGLVTSTVSLTLFVNTFGGLGLTNSLVRFLALRPASSRRLFIDAALITQVVGAAALSILWFTPLRPAVGEDQQALAQILLTYAFMAASLLTMLTDAALLSYHRTGTVVVKTGVGGLVKVAALAIPMGSADGVTRLLAVQTAGTVVSCGIAAWVLLASCLSGDNRSRRDALGGIWRFSLGNYAGLIVGIVPTSLSPLLVVRGLDAADAAYFSVSAMILGLVNVAASSMSQSMFNETQQGTDPLGALKRSARGLLALLVPGVVVALLVCPLILRLFGEGYAENGTWVLRLILLAAIPASASYLFDSFVNALGDARGFLMLNLQNSVIVLLGVYWGTQRDLTSVGLGWLIGQIVAVAISALYCWVRVSGSRRGQHARRKVSLV